MPLDYPRGEGAHANRQSWTRAKFTHVTGALANVRAKESLQKLSEGERAAWQKFWDDVDALVNQLRQKK